MIREGRRYRPDIDGLRALAVCVVLVFHAFPALLPGGFIGVDVFFVISGYLISGIILGAHAESRFSFTHFYARRIRRIFPALGVVLAALLIAGWFLLYADDYARLAYHAAAGAAFISNLAFWKESSYFDVAADLKPLLHLWSLGVEEQFYLVWPILLVAAARWRRGPLITTLLIGTISFAIAIWTVRIDRTPAFYAPWNRFWELLAGATLACMEADAVLDSRMRRLVSSRSVPAILAALGLAAIVAGVILIDATRVFPGLWALLPVVGTVSLILAGPDAWVNRAILSRPPVVFVGLISYPLYLWHWPLLSFARIRAGDEVSSAIRLVLLVASVGLAWITYRLIERPVRFGPRGRLAVPVLAVSLSAVVAAGVYISRAGGMIDRRINRSDAARFVDYYERLRKTELGAVYHHECDFMEWGTGATRDAIDPSCTVAGPRQTVMLWGDSYASALSLGVRESLPPDVALAQVTTSACKAAIDNFDLTVKDRRCERANRYALETIARLRPATVIVAQSNDHAQTDWPALSSKVLALGAGRVVIVGPFPFWRAYLPRIYAEHHLKDRAEYVGTGLDAAIFEDDRIVASRVANLANVTYVSLLAQLCRTVGGRACLARVPGEDELDLMVLDFGHLTPKGSSYLGRTIWKPFLDRIP